jgi:hypothetical protein
VEARAKLIQADIEADKKSAATLLAHESALKARIERLAKQQLVTELRLQAAQYAAAWKKLESESYGIGQVAQALSARTEKAEKEIAPVF